MERQQQLLASLAGEGGGEGRGGEAATATSELEHKPPPPRGLLGDLASASAVPSGGGRQGQPPPARPRGRRRLRFVYKRRRVLHLDDLASASSSIPAIDIGALVGVGVRHPGRRHGRHHRQLLRRRTRRRRRRCGGRVSPFAAALPCPRRHRRRRRHVFARHLLYFSHADHLAALVVFLP
ncbi:Os03g0397033 [Oryza sativa Japonica Group]|uniref:Os03g0397033 protein n=1 Tax=Oryza sativa subsp. japonica TaxID=39947 RepID=A0A0P0VZ48_ORYSJ|nr:Os03g0397033 [Oryza sativa Japonica Group]